MLIGQINHERYGGMKWLKRRAGQSPSRLPRDVGNDCLDQSTLIALQSRHVSFNLRRGANRNDCLPVHTSDKGVGSQEADSAGQQTVHGAGEEAIAEEQQGRHEAGDVQLEHVVPDTVGKDPEGAASASQEALPPPVIVLGWSIMSSEFEVFNRENHTSEQSWL